MSTFRRLDRLLDGKTSDELARDIAARERERTVQDQRDTNNRQTRPGGGQPPTSSRVTTGTSGSSTSTARSLVNDAGG